jgi:hypothetical protein
MAASSIEAIRSELLMEAKASPNLLSDLAGLEAYIAESYRARSIAELLQNADDAGATRVAICTTADSLIVANDGRPFTANDLLALCRSASSTKGRGTSIGYRGIGFKSVVEFATTVHLLSGGYALSFSRERTRSEIPAATRVPLVRIPHELLDDELGKTAKHVDSLREEGFTTVFSFPGARTSAIDEELETFDASGLLFLRSVAQLLFRGNVSEAIVVNRRRLEAGATLARLTSSTRRGTWLVFGETSGASVACPVEDHRGAPGVFHAFLPTEEPSGFGASLHADFSTDPSRRRIVVDDHSRAAAAEVGHRLAEILGDAATATRADHPAVQAIPALVPKEDPRLAELQRRSVRVLVLQAMRGRAPSQIGRWRSKPEWLNGADFALLVRAADGLPIPGPLAAVEALVPLLKYLGAQDAKPDELLSAAANVQVSAQGCAELVAQLVARHAAGVLSLDRERLLQLEVWETPSGVQSIRHVVDDSLPLADRFLERLSEHSVPVRDLSKLLGYLVGDAAARRLTQGHEAGLAAVSAPSASSDAGGHAPLPDRSTASGQSRPGALTLSRWRSAEEQALAILNSQGYKLADVSRQNLGFDLSGQDAHGQPVFVEVKSVPLMGGSFHLTNNEYATAQACGSRYIIALVRQAEKEVELALIVDPLARLKFGKQCRQWVWECPDYTVSSTAFPVS